MSLTLSKPDRLSLFSFLWAAATFFHLLALQDTIFKPTIVIAICAFIVLLKPKSLIVFMLMLFLSVCRTFYLLPNPPNHLLFDLLINTGILTAFSLILVPDILRSGFKAAFENADRERLFNSFAPMVRIGLLILYFYAVLHKLNHDFLNPEISCGTDLLREIREFGFTFIPDNPVVRFSAVYGTLLFEAAIPILLCFKKTRMWGIILGLLFHFILSVHPNPGLLSFSGLLFAVYFLFTPHDFPEKLHSIASEAFQGNRQTFRTFLLVLSVGLISIAGIILIIELRSPFYYVKYGTWFIWAIFLMATYFTVIRFAKFERADFSETFRMRQRLLWMVPFLILVNGLNPYLGLKTEISFSMFSNLRTEGGITNHLFIPASYHITQWQKDLVDIADTDHKLLSKFIDRKQLITFFEFRRIASKTAKDFYVNYYRNGINYTLKVQDGISNITEATTPIPWLQAKLIRFRPIDKGACLCKH